ncbi:putative methyltransferase NSUN6 isoform X1 [Gopherus evgoodei]|uniref:putative methyltransferase NSUN6 isoform X1 n=1 Tax=Gopherus evgoodei TaxID=1825980 RepID=UPI0011CF930D|nr:putative methyltransferase NSUN6 isoform X1 [Gopherus evgoodei]XP_030406283.1 putative methyltransferase NSUN6 isoform X1 [Gopherus evgoodei]XP_030406284.1 putative methyltransferase NSUN6 isoform X1 [Gopherus evgoodei]XP_030406285.1 putative methyltransferase NSUN6 isoform X1 [Gopherus evgoodei]
MSSFSKILLQPEVEEYLGHVFRNKELISALGTLEAERKYESLLNCLSHPPAFTTVRVNTHLASVKQVKNLLFEEIHKQFKDLSVPVLQHPELQDLLLIPVIGPRKDLQKQSSEVIVGAQCGNSVLRGAHVFVPGIISASKFMKAGDVVSVYSDIEGKCKRGAKVFLGTKVFIGNGISELSRSEIFSSSGSLKGIGIRMTDPVYLSPSLDNVLSSYLFLQNLPSAVVSHVLNPQPGERILDMCAAPGGKTTHLATLMHDQGEVIAMDKIANKVKKIKQNAALLQLNCVKAFCCDGTKVLATGKKEDGQGAVLMTLVLFPGWKFLNEGPPFSAESFDRILLDVPCSGMGQRPNMAYFWTLKEVMSYQPLQRKLFSTAVKLLKPGGTLVYSTCTITLSENEEQVAWALETFPCLQLQSQEPHIGGEGMMGAGLSLDQLKLLQRFDPSSVTSREMDINSLQDSREDDLILLANKDCIGFFIAKFIKLNSK